MNRNPFYYTEMRVKFSLIFAQLAVVSICFLCSPSQRAAAQDVQAAPVPAVEQESIPASGDTPIFIELFSSQACVFCPKADRLFADLIKQDNIIGIACHVDYFDVTQGSLAHQFCSARQSWYMDTLFAGPNYTPQMIINGDTEVIAYKLSTVAKSLKKASHTQIDILPIAETDVPGTYKVTLPLEKLDHPEDAKLWLALYDKPHSLKIADGLNKGKPATYYNIVSELGQTENLIQDVFVTPPLKEHHAGFVVILQDTQTGKIYGVGQYKQNENANQSEL